MHSRIALLLMLAASGPVFAQKNNVINVSDVTRIETTLSSDDMQGRRAGTPAADKAAAFIADEFKKAGLQPAGNSGYLQTFSTIRTRIKELKAKFNESDVDAKSIVVFSAKPSLEVDENSGYAVKTIAAKDDFFKVAKEVIFGNQPAIVVADTSFKRNFQQLPAFKRQMTASQKDVVFIMADAVPKKFKIKLEQDVTELKLANVVGILPGRSKKNELVIFSGHYDHLGIAKQPVNNDSIYNGANDDAAGITAVIELANYYKGLNNNERTLVFAAFAAEEIGGFGSQYFSKQYDPANVVAMFNIEMIGTDSKWGKNSAYITGYEKSNMGQILQNNLKGTDFTFYPDPYTQQNLFYRSDNATLARLGVPAHTISTAKMEDEPNYHKLSDEIGTLDMENMTAIIKAIATSATSIVNGKETPSRVKTEDIRPF